MSNQEFKRRREKVAKEVDLGYFTHQRELYYLTGRTFSRALLIICDDNHMLFVDDRYLEMSMDIKDLTVLHESKLASCIEKLKFEKVTLDGSLISYANWKLVEKRFSGKKLLDLAPLNALRLQKSPYELQILKEAAALSIEGYQMIRETLKEGAIERDVAKRLEIWLLNNGADGVSFSPIIAFADHTALPHYRNGDRALQKDSAVIIDFGITYKGYVSDMTRSFYFGNRNKEYEEMKELVHKSFSYILENLTVGQSSSYIDQLYYDFMEKYNLKGAIKHALGHSLGLEVHEWPTLRCTGEDVTLPEHSVLAIEPGLYFRGKWGIRHEEMVHLSKSGCEIITKEKVDS